MLYELILYLSGGTYSLKVGCERQIFEKLFHGRFIYLRSELLLEICWEEIAEEIIVLHISFWCLTWNTNPGFSFNKPTHYLFGYNESKLLQRTLRNLRYDFEVKSKMTIENKKKNLFCVFCFHFLKFYKVCFN